MGRLRYVTRAFQIRLPKIIQYLNDDGSELPKEPDKPRALTAQPFRVSLVGLTPAIWENIYSLPPGFSAPIWDTLYLNAIAALPHIGTAVVLAATALEVFIAQTLNHLAVESDAPAELWEWVNKRENRDNNPSVEEQFSGLLKMLVGHSLKENTALWQDFMNLKTARNKFVHEGVAMVGGQPISDSEAKRLVHQAAAVINCIRQWLPESVQWPSFEPSTKFEISLAIPVRSRAAATSNTEAHQ